MSVADDYPAVRVLQNAWRSRDRGDDVPPEVVRMFEELDLVRHVADRSLKLSEQLRAECLAWMTGVADIVEPFGYDRQAASGPSDLLPGLDDLRNERNELFERVVELETRLERHPVTTGGHESLLDSRRRKDLARIVPPAESKHQPIRQPGSNLCVCGAPFDREVHEL